MVEQRLFYRIGLQNRLLVLIRWTVSFVSRGRGARLILWRADVTAGHAVAASQSAGALLADSAGDGRLPATGSRAR